MVENVTVTPGDVRGGGNIVNPNKTVLDFIGKHCDVSVGTDTVDNVTETVYTSKQFFLDTTGDYYCVPTRLVVEKSFWFEDDINLTVKLQIENGQDTWRDFNPSSAGFSPVLYCDYDGIVTSQTMSSTDGVSFTITPREPGLVSLRFYFKGRFNTLATAKYGACFKNVTVLSCSADAVFEFIDYNTVMQTDDVNPILTRLSCNGVGIPGQIIQFYEDYIEAILNVYSDKSIIQTGDTVGVFARLSDEDGSAIAGELVKFYEEYGDIEIVVSSTKPIIESGEVAPITAYVHDEDGVVIGEQIDFYEEYDIRKVTAYASPNIIQTGDVATVYGKVQDEDGSLVEGALVKFYEDYDLSAVKVYAAKNIIQSSDTVAVYARVSDEDGSAIPGQTVHFYEDYEVTNITLSSSKNPLQSSETAVLTAKVRDEDGSVVRDERVDYEVDYEDDYSISMTVDEELIQTGETAGVSVTVKDGNTPVEDVYIRFYDDNE